MAVNKTVDMTGYVKLFGSILASTIWREDDKTRLVWITMLAMSNKNGIVEASVPGLADFARVSVEECRTALRKLESPDPDSRTKIMEGRRIEAIDGGWAIINHGKYREKMGAEERRQYLALKQREHRERKARQQPVNSVNKKSTRSTHAEAEAEAEADPSPDVGKAADAARPSLGGSASIVSSSKSDIRPPAGTSPISAKPPSKVPLNDEEWLRGLESDPTYAGINVRQELGKMNRWCAVNQKHPTQRRFINWLNRTDKPIQAAIVQPSKAASADVPKSDDPSLF